jgi:hypothetical protein
VFNVDFDEKVNVEMMLKAENKVYIALSEELEPL